MGDKSVRYTGQKPSGVFRGVLARQICVSVTKLRENACWDPCWDSLEQCGECRFNLDVAC